MDIATSTPRRKKYNTRLVNCKPFIFMLPDRLRKQCNAICTSRGIELAEYVRESIIKNNKNYEFLLRNI